jgi:hypothetical protein
VWVVREARCTYEWATGVEFVLFFAVLRGRRGAMLDEGRTVLPSSDPTFALIVIAPPGFLGVDESGS